MPLAFLILAAAAGALPPSTPTATEGLRSAMGALLQADGPDARRMLLAVPEHDLDARDASFRSCALNRLSGTGDAMPSRAPATGTPFVDRLIARYHRYWTAAALHPAGRDAEREALLADLSVLLGHSFSDMPQAEAAVAARLSSAGLHGQLGRTGLLNDLMIWSTERPIPTRVDLPGGPVIIQVIYLDGFSSLGWSRYLSCGRTGTGGWTTDAASYVIVPSYGSLTDENFRVNLLAHEGQIAADKHAFVGLPAWRLEYRAKLAELAAARHTLSKVLTAFRHDQGDDPEEPHSYADRRVLTDLITVLRIRSEGDLPTAPRRAVNAAAVELLRRDTSALEG